MRVVTTLLLLCGLAAAQQSTVLAPGQPARQIQLRSHTDAPVPIDTLVSNGPLLLVFLPENAAPCQAVTDAIPLRAATRIEIAIVSVDGTSGRTACDATPGIRTVYMGTPASPRAQAIIVDDTVYARWRAEVPADPSGWSTLQAGVEQWLQGRQVYEVNCGHCHGFDGRSASSPDVKPLAGITRKYQDAKVLELGAQFGGVDMTGWSPAKKESLLLYLRGL